MKEMDFSTHNKDCELFLTAQGIGFLMVTANGFVSRKWQGLTIEDFSILAGLTWEFSHQLHHTSPLQPHNWLFTQRKTCCITRHWRADCGCQLTETWDWTHPQNGLVISMNRSDARNCNSSHNETCSIRLRPLWTMEYAGIHTCGANSAKTSIKLDSKNKITAQVPGTSGLVEFFGHTEDTADVGGWYQIEQPQQDWLPTSKDAARGEHHEREVFTSHEFRTVVRHSSNVSMVLKYSSAGGVSTNTIPCDHSTFQPVPIECENKSLEATYINSMESLNQLIQTRPDATIGLQAGLPWFTQFWTRDLCHSFRAAFLWSNRTQDAEELITQLWKRSKGKVIPNFTTTHSTAENSIDALPLLLLSTADLVDRIGLTEKISNILNEVKERIYEGAQIFNSKKLIEHRDADTWMDAQRWTQSGRLIACSPRANRAFEIQAFWLAAIARWSEILRLTDTEAPQEVLQSALRQGITLVREKYFEKQTNRWADTLRRDDTPDFAVRPNVLLGLQALDRAELIEQLLDSQELRTYLESLIELNLITPYGVRTLSPETSVRHHLPINSIFQSESAYIHENKIHFHPYHEFGSRHGLEHPDWAYHNGTIWPWLSHPACQLFMLSGLTEHAQPLVRTLIHHSTEGAQGGALPELLDGLTSHSSWSWAKGAPHQAWSASAFIHITLENILGLRIKSLGNELHLNSAHWNQFSHLKTQIQTKSGDVNLVKDRNAILISFQPRDDKSELILSHADSRNPKSKHRIKLSSSHTQSTLNLMYK